MSVTQLLYPVFVQVLLTFVVLFMMGFARNRAITTAKSKPNMREVALGGYQWPDQATKVANNFSNQFELPVLFYAAIAFAMILKQRDMVMLVLAWAFVATRVLHTFLHVGANIVQRRFLAYLAGAACLMALWGVLAFRVLTGDAGL